MPSRPSTSRPARSARSSSAPDWAVPRAGSPEATTTTRSWCGPGGSANRGSSSAGRAAEVVDADRSFEETLRHQLKMNRVTGERLREHGVDATTRVRIDFFYEAAAQDSASALVRYLQAETDYDVTADAAEGEAGEASVQGSTQPTTI